MKTNAVYPGSFQPSIEVRNHRSRNYMADAFPTWEINRHPDMLFVRCWLPGVRREEIDLSIRNKRVCISVLSSLPDHFPDSFTPIRYLHQFPLPSDADPLLISAEYHRGMLCLRIPLAPKDQSVDPVDMHVVVY